MMTTIMITMMIVVMMMMINDLEDDISSKVLKFADDKKYSERLLMIQINKVYRMM